MPEGDKIEKKGVSVLVLPDGKRLRNQIIEINNGKVCRFYPLIEEIAFTEWDNSTFAIDTEGYLYRKD